MFAADLKLTEQWSKYWSLWNARFHWRRSWCLTIYHYSLRSSFKKQLYPSVQDAIDAMAFQLPEELLLGNGVKSFGEIQDKHVHLAAVVHHFCKIMACQ